MPNIKLIEETLEFIKALPEANTVTERVLDPRINYWKQSSWGYKLSAKNGVEKHQCGTCACYAGWVVYNDNPNNLFSGQEIVGKKARDLLEITEIQAQALFHENNEIEDLEQIIKEIKDNA